MTLGTAFDALIIGFLILQTFLGWRRGLLWQAAGVASLAFGVALGWLTAPLLSDYLTAHVTSDPFRAKLIAFLFVLGLTGFLLRMAAAWAEVHAERGLPKNERDLRRADDRILGGIFGALKGSVLTLVFVAAGVAFYPRHDLWQQSKLAEVCAVAGSRLLPDGAVDEIRAWASDSGSGLKQGLDIKAAARAKQR